ncbi:hypothetical protein BJV85_002916 [Clostridium acetobutylicum]|nr:hypothetical protein [Clostridium acetobutylicum]NOV89903.1 hypothetical protein [Clostridium acetobutylicum]NSA93993.1 hypothetical protein [Clostridium acetobutylicum]
MSKIYVYDFFEFKASSLEKYTLLLNRRKNIIKINEKVCYVK